MSLAFAVLFGFSAARSPAQDPEPMVTAQEKAQGYSNRGVLAKSREGFTDVELAAAETREGLRLRRRPAARSSWRVLDVSQGEDVVALVDRLNATGRYEFVELDYIRKIRTTPNDPRFLNGDQWALRNIGQNGGTAGADIQAENGWEVQSAASNIVVAVIDSGLRRSHEDLAPNLWINPAPNTGGYINDINGINATVALNTTGNGAPDDGEGHGTAVASVLGAAGNNGAGMSGVAWKVKLMALRYLDANGFGFISDEVECIDYAIAKGAHLINLSSGGTAFSQSEFQALKRARDAGIIVVCAAGNESENIDLYSSYPSGYLLENIITVASTTRTDALSSFSSYGSGLVDLGAPGSSILVADATGDRNYLVYSGTSFSAPLVTGAFALLKAKFPSDNYRETINRLLRSVDAQKSLAGKTVTGGRLNLAAALRATSARPFNDDFAQRATLVGETVTARSAAQSSTREVGEPVHAGTPGNGSQWWTWTAPRKGTVTIETTGSAVDTLLSVYTGSTVSALTAVASNDDESATVTTSKVSFAANAGTTYQIAVDSKASASGLVVLRLALLSSNDMFDSAQVVAGRSWSIRSDNRPATRETGEPRIKNNVGGHSVWYRWTAPATRRYHLSSFSSEFNTMIAVYTGAALSSLIEINAATTDGDSNSTMNSAGLTFTATAGTTYYITLDSEVSAAGTSATGAFSLSCADSDWEFFGIGGPSTVAVAADDTLHFVDDYGYLYALNTDGSRKWRYSLTGYGTFSAPAISGEGTVYVGDSFGYFHAINPDGTRKWRAALPGLVQGATALTMVQSSPAIAPDGTVYVRSDDGRLYALSPADGTVRWSHFVGTASANTYSSPVVAPDGTIYCAGPASRLYAIAPDGKRKWEFATDFIYTSPAIASDGTIYFGVVAPTRRFYALRPDGTVKWEFIAGDTLSSSPAIGLDGTIYFGCADKNLYALTPSGDLRWKFAVGDAIRNSSPAVANDGTIYVGCLDGKVYAVKPDGTLNRVYATSSEVRSSPVLHKGRLYVSSHDYRLYSFDVGQVPASSAWPMHRHNVRRIARAQPQPLAIGAQPRAVTAEVSEIVTFAVGAVGTAPLTYQWFFNGQPIPGATATTYSVDPVIHANGGQYSARVTDATGAITSNSVALTVSTPLIPPSVFTAPLSQAALAGASVTLSVSALGTTPMTYQWLRDGTAIAGATASSLRLTPARLTDSGSYSVRIANFGGTLTSSAAELTINPVSRISNLSIRTRVGGTAGELTVGLTVGGSPTANKPLLIRAVGPTLDSFGVSGALADPRLAILSGSTVIAQNDDWSGSADVTSTGVNVGAFALASATSKDAALARALEGGSYTVRISGAGTGSGVALAEVYDGTAADTFFIDTPRLVNVSALTQVGTGGDILIAGFAVTGVAPRTVLIRGIGPTLGAFGVAGALSDPKLELFQAGSATATAVNDNWGAAANAPQVSAAATSVGAFALAADSRDAVLLLSLPPGSYTAQVSGVNNTTGIALVEVYEVP